jgi:outer membrane protein OmpA-like peptidoglycan-associated protein
VLSPVRGDGTRGIRNLRTVVTRFWWLALLILTAVLVAARLLGGWASGIAREEAAAAAGIPIERVEMDDGLNVRLTGFATEAERDAAVSAVDKLESSWVVTGDIDVAETADHAVDDVAAAEVDDAGPTSAAPTSAAPTSAAPTTEVSPPTSAVATPTSASPPAPTTASTAPSTDPEGTQPVEQVLNALFELEPIWFDTNRADIRPSTISTLDRAAALIREYADGQRLRIVGHTDSDGASGRNQTLSERRAQAVVDYLVQTGGVDPARLEAAGQGERALTIDPELTIDDKQRNRRIEWVLLP